MSDIYIMNIIGKVIFGTLLVAYSSLYLTKPKDRSLKNIMWKV